MKNASLMIILKTGFLFAGAIIGAGFVAGSEILIFFTDHSFENPLDERSFGNGLAGLGISAFIFFSHMWMVLSLSKKKNIIYPDDFYQFVFRNGAKIFSTIVTIFGLVVYAAMLGGAGELLSKFTKISPGINALIILLSGMLIFRKGIELFRSVSLYMTMMLIGGILCFGATFLYLSQAAFPDLHSWMDYFKFVDGREIQTLEKIACMQSVSSDPWSNLKRLGLVAGNAFLYCGYNSILALNCLLALNKFVKRKTEAFLGSVLGGLLFFVPAVLIYLSINPFISILQYARFPMAELIGTADSVAGFLFSGVLFLAMFLGSIMNGYFIYHKSPMLLVIAFLISFTGFSDIIKTFYPLFGYAGIFYLCVFNLKYFMIYFQRD